MCFAGGERERVKGGGGIKIEEGGRSMKEKIETERG